jgi:hypothetical protein
MKSDLAHQSQPQQRDKSGSTFGAIRSLGQKNWRSHAERLEPAMAPRKLSSGHADRGQLEHGHAASSGPWRGPNPRQSKWLSVDPYMRGRMSPATNYTKGVAIGEVMQGGGVGEVVVSNHPAWKVGDIAESMSFGWQEWSVLTPDTAGPASVNRIDPGLARSWPTRRPNRQTGGGAGV